MNRTESGSVLWFILIAIVLLGALTGILSRSSVEQSGDFENRRVQASQIIRYAQSIEAAIEHMVLQGVSENEISFENPVTSTDYTNTRCDDAADAGWPGCMVFNVQGGGLEYRSASQGGQWIFTAANNVGTTAAPVGTTAMATGNDLLMLLPGLSESLCEQINFDLDVSTGAIPEDDTGISVAAFDGSYPGGGPIILDGDAAPFELDGRNAGCFTDGATSETYFYYVILAR